MIYERFLWSANTAADGERYDTEYVNRTGMTFPYSDGRDIGPRSPQDYLDLVAADPDFRHVLNDHHVMTIPTREVIEEHEKDHDTARQVPLEGHEFSRATM